MHTKRNSYNPQPAVELSTSRVSYNQAEQTHGSFQSRNLSVPVSQKKRKKTVAAKYEGLTKDELN